MYRYYFKLANLVIQINAPFVIEKFYEMEIYRIEYAEKINAQYTIEMFPENPGKTRGYSQSGNPSWILY